MAIDSLSSARKPAEVKADPPPPPPPPPAPAPAAQPDRYQAPAAAPAPANLTGEAGGAPVIGLTEQGGGEAPLPSFKAGFAQLLVDPAAATISAGDSARTEAAKAPSAPAPKPPEEPTGDPAADAEAVRQYAQQNPVEGAKVYRSYAAQYDPAKQAEFVAQSAETVKLLGEASRDEKRPLEERERIATEVASTFRDLPAEQRAEVARTYAPISGDPVKDAAAIQALTEKSPILGAVAFEMAMTQLPPEGRDRLVAQPATQRALNAMGNAAADEKYRGKKMTDEQRMMIIAPVARAVDASQGPVVLEVSKWFAPGINEQNAASQGLQRTDPAFVSFTQALKSVIADGNGAQLGIGLTEVFKTYSPQFGMKYVMDATLGGINGVRERFTEAANEVDELNGKLYEQLSAIGPGLTDEQREAFIQKWRNDPAHKAKYDAYESAARGYTRTGDDLSWLKERAPRGFEGSVSKTIDAMNGELARVAKTPAGQEFFRAQLERSGKGEPNVFQTLSEELKSNVDFMDKFSEALMQGVSMFSTLQDELGDAWMKSPTVSGWIKQVELLGLKQADAESFLGLAVKLGKVPDEAQIRAIGGEMAAIADKMKLPGTGEPLPRAQAALKGLGVMVSWAAFAQSSTQFGAMPASERFKLVGDGMNATGDTFAFISDGLGLMQTLPKLTGAAKVFGAAGIGLGAVVDGFMAIESFRSGDAWRGLAQGASSLGGVLLALGAVATTGVGAPIAAAGGLIYAGGILLNQYADYRENKAQQDQNFRYLQELGLSEADAKTLAYSDPTLLGGLGKLGMNWAQVRTVAQRYPDHPGAYLEDMEKFARESGLGGDQMFELLNYELKSPGELDAFGRFASASGQEQWSKQEWLAYLEQSTANPTLDPSERAVAARMLEYLRNPPVRDY